MNHKKTIIALAVIMIAAVPLSLAVSDDSDAEIKIGKIRGEGFTNSGDGTLFVVLGSTEPAEQKITVKVTEDGRELATVAVDVPAESEYTAELRFRLNGIGDHYLTVTCEPAGLFPTPLGGDPFNYDTVVVNVTETIWSKPSTYAALIVVALLIAIAAYLRMRSAPAGKSDTTFTELEKQRKDISKTDSDEPSKASATERKRYRSSDEPSRTPAKQTAPPAEKAVSFTDLEKQRDEKKGSAPKKESSSEEPKKLKYISSRRK
ncbi:MAG: hypothetical protein LBJ20_01335 [Candidatus Methanoplasma sp.]|jgi:hypothetical protein|nr:hypothetical protein [Candidatus Methanoplasma sp.]